MTKYKEEYVHSDHLLYVQLGENVRKLRKLCLRLANAFHVSVDTLLEGVVEYEMVQTLLNDTSEQLLAQELLQVVKRYIREAEK